jgi:hypothetical protein
MPMAPLRAARHARHADGATRAVLWVQQLRSTSHGVEVHRKDELFAGSVRSTRAMGEASQVGGPQSALAIDITRAHVRHVQPFRSRRTRQ